MRGWLSSAGYLVVDAVVVPGEECEDFARNERFPCYNVKILTYFLYVVPRSIGEVSCNNYIEK